MYLFLLLGVSSPRFRSALQEILQLKVRVRVYVQNVKPTKDSAMNPEFYLDPTVCYNVHVARAFTPGQYTIVYLQKFGPSLAKHVVRWYQRSV